LNKKTNNNACKCYHSRQPNIQTKQTRVDVTFTLCLCLNPVFTFDELYSRNEFSLLNYF